MAAQGRPGSAPVAARVGPGSASLATRCRLGYAAAMELSPQLRVAEQHLRDVDRAMHALVPEAGPCRLDESVRRQAFPALMRTIISQQISVQAASTIERRVRALFGGRPPSARRLLEMDEDRLRAAGLSRQKTAYLKDLASRVCDRSLNLAGLERMSDEEVLSTLTAIKGIGRWTAEIFMMFRLGRLDLLPVDDIGLLEGARLLYELPERPDGERLLELAEPWRPYRTVGSWYLWQAKRMANDLPLR